MPRSLTESPALLTLHSTGEGHYLVRVSDTKRRGLITGLCRLLDDATVITMVLPNDIKVFTVNGNGAAPEVDVPADAEDASDAPPVTDPETLAAIAAEERKSLPNATDDAAADEDVEPLVESRPRARRRAKPESVSGHPEPCGRCSGSGQIRMLLDGGQPGSTACPVCHGSGTLLRYGVRR
jgi:hypothetical protein